MTLADQLVDAIYPWWSQDFEDLARAIGSMWQHVELYALARDDGTAAWSVMVDPENAPTEALPYLAQWVGEQLRAGLTDEQMREWINDKPNSRRGSPESIALAAQRSLVGGRVVQLFERTDANGEDDPLGDHFVVYTYAADTPDPNQVWEDLLTVIPADMVCDYTVLESTTWAEIDAGFDTWADVHDAYSTWTEVAGGVQGGMSWSR